MKNKGITLIALIVTVIIMIILAAVSIRIITSGGIIDKTRDAAIETIRQEDYEEFLMAVICAKEYYGKNSNVVNMNKLREELGDSWKVEDIDGKRIKGTSPNENKFEIDEITSEINGIRKECLIEIEDKYGNKNEYYRLDKVTEEERKKCKEHEIPMLVADVNLDGKINENDKELLKNIVSGVEDYNEIQLILGDFDNDADISSMDLSIITAICNEDVSLRKYAIYKETEIELDKILVDEETGKLYYLEERVTEEEAKELEKYGVNKILLGDVNFDGQLTIEDADLIIEYYGGTIDFTSSQIIIGDMNEDGDINALDSVVIKSIVKNK